jgi:hypothetical protein
MRYAIAAIFCILIASSAIAASTGLGNPYINELTDESPVVTRIIECIDVTDLIVFVTTDKGLTVTITPLPDYMDADVVGPVSDTLTIADGGGSDSAIYSRIGTPLAKIVVTKTEAGSTDGFNLTVRGIK